MPGLSQVSFKGLISSFSIQVVPRFLIQIKLNIDQYRALKWYGIGILFENLRYWYWDLFRKSQVLELILVSFLKNTGICIGIGIEMENLKYSYCYRY